MKSSEICNFGERGNRVQWRRGGFFEICFTEAGAERARRRVLVTLELIQILS